MANDAALVRLDSVDDSTLMDALRPLAESRAMTVCRLRIVDTVRMRDSNEVDRRPPQRSDVAMHKRTTFPEMKSDIRSCRPVSNRSACRTCCTDLDRLYYEK